MRALAVVSLALFSTTAAAQTCLVRSRAGSLQVRVSPRGSGGFALALDGIPMLLVPGARATVHVLGPFAFRASATNVEYAVARPIDVAAGMVRLRSNARVTRARAVGADARGVIGIGAAVEVHGADVPCDALTLDDVPRTAFPLERGPADGVDENVPGWIPARRTTVLREEPGRGARIVLTAADRDELRFIEREAQGEWRRVLFDDGSSTVEGWTRTSSLRPERDGPFGIGMSGVGEGCGGSGDGMNPDVFDGDAVVDFGTTVFAAPGRAPWASVRTGEPLHIVHLRGERWATIANVPGMAETCMSLQHAFVLAESVRFPGSAGPR